MYLRKGLRNSTSIAPDDDDVGAHAGQDGGRLEADSAGGAGYEDGLSFDHDR